MENSSVAKNRRGDRKLKNKSDEYKPRRKGNGIIPSRGVENLIVTKNVKKGKKERKGNGKNTSVSNNRRGDRIASRSKFGRKTLPSTKIGFIPI
jgi:hypothetical protein